MAADPTRGTGCLLQVAMAALASAFSAARCASHAAAGVSGRRTASVSAVRRSSARGAAKGKKRAGGGFGSKPAASEGPACCPCGGGAAAAPYKKCCAPYHDGAMLPPTAEALMRSRYSAFVKKKIKYLVETTHEEHPGAKGMRLDNGEIQSTLAEDLKATCDKCVFLGLEVLETQGGLEGDAEGEVYFETKFTIAGQRGFRQRGKKDAPQSLRERSRFVRAEVAEAAGDGAPLGRWLYREGTPEGEGYKAN